MAEEFITPVGLANTGNSQFWNLSVDNDGNLDFKSNSRTTGATRMSLHDDNGNVGIGTGTPQAPLHIYSPGNPTTLRLQSSRGFGVARMEFWSDPQGATNEWRPGFIQSTDEGGFTGGLAFFVNGTGFSNRTAAQEVMRITNGNVRVNGDIILENADCAEDFPVEDPSVLEPGTVVAIGDGVQLRISDREYNKRVAGIIAGAGDLKPGIILGRKEKVAQNRPVALMGRVNCKVDATQNAIEVGDLLTTSSMPGHAMKATDPLKAFGSVIGKALGSLDSGTGMIPVLVALQ